jgi:dTMP kinase
VLPDLLGAIRGRPLAVGDADQHRGLLVAFEGGEGAGKSTQALKLTAWLKVHGHETLTTFQPGATQLGRHVRELLLGHGDTAPTARAEALLYAADRAHHIDTVVRPALERGSVVVTDRYIDSSLAYQGGGRGLPVDEVAWLSNWATRCLRPDLVVLLDIDPAVGLLRAGDRGAGADRLESESRAFHDRVRRAFLELAAADPRRYLVIDASGNPAIIAEQVQARVAELLPPPPARAATDDVVEVER